MESRELRLGNWITAYNATFQIGSINNEFVEPIGGNDGQFAINDLKGIPLSPDILLKAGFEKVFGTFQLKASIGFLFGFDDDVLNQFSVYFEIPGSETIISVYSLHQLQNLYFALTSTELEITL